MGKGPVSFASLPVPGTGPGTHIFQLRGVWLPAQASICLLTAHRKCQIPFWGAGGGNFCLFLSPWDKVKLGS